MIVAGYPPATCGYIFLRGEYRLAPINRALDEARAHRVPGEEHPWLGLQPPDAPHLSAGRYMCGEETALLNALEGKRANRAPRP